MAREGITLYIPAFNAEKTLSACLEGVFHQTRTPDEILVIDDGSSDRTAQIAKKMGARVISHPTNKGIAASRNTAVREAPHPLIANIDADVVPKPDWLEKLLEALDENIAGVGGKLEEGFQEGIVNKWRTIHMCQHWGDAIVENPVFLHGANSLYRKSAIEAVGGYDERCKRNFEDNDLGLRLRERGYHLRYTPYAVAVHLRQDNLSSLLKTAWGWSRRPRDAQTLNYKARKLALNFYTFAKRARKDLATKSLSSLGVSFLVAMNNTIMDLRFFATGREDEWWKKYQR